MSAKRVDIGRYPGDFWERSREAWADIEGRHWQVYDATEPSKPDIPVEQLWSWMAESSQRLTDRQRLYLDAYYNKGLSCELIAYEHNVTRSTVSRTIRIGINKMRIWVEAKKLIALHTDQQGNCDWHRIFEHLPASLLPEQQRQLLIMKISNPMASNRELSDSLGLSKSDVSKTFARAYRSLQNLGILDLFFNPIGRIDWEQCLRKANVLTEHQRKVVLIKLSNPELNHNEIGAVLGATRSSVSSTLCRAKHNLQQLDVLEGIPIQMIIKVLNKRKDQRYEFIREKAEN